MIPTAKPTKLYNEIKKKNESDLFLRFSITNFHPFEYNTNMISADIVHSLGRNMPSGDSRLIMFGKYAYN